VEFKTKQKKTCHKRMFSGTVRPAWAVTKG